MAKTLIKYPRTPHLPNSPGATNDDKILSSLDCFKNKPLVATIKMDGENTTLTKDACYARSLDSRHHKSRSWIKGLHGQLAYNIPEGWRICGENVYAKHSIFYDDLPSYFLVFNIWNSFNQCLSWDATKTWCDRLNLELVPILHENVDIDTVNALTLEDPRLNGHEGFVVRVSDTFFYDDFSKNVAKYVRPNHVSTDKHWMHSKLEINRLKQ